MYQQSCTTGADSNRAEALRYALAAAEAGRAVIPLEYKEPLAPHGHKDASRDRSRITAMFNKAGSRATGYGIATGQRSGVVVVDVDGPEGRAEAERLGLRSGYTVRTGRKRDGWHVYFTIPPGVEAKSRQLAPGVELKAEGCYVVGAGSLHPEGRRYRAVKDGEPSPAPDSLLEPERSGTDTRHVEHSPGPVSIDTAGPTIPYGERNGVLARIVGRLHDGTRDLDTLTRDLLAVNTARCTPPLPEREVERIAASIHRRPPCKPSGPEVTPETLDVLEGITAAMLADDWSTPRVRGRTAESYLRAMLRGAAEHGELLPCGGVRYGVSLRASARDTEIASLNTVRAARAELKRRGYLREDNAGRSGPKAGAIVLLIPECAKLTHSPTGGALGEGERASVSIWRAPHLRASCAGHQRLGKPRESAIVAVLASVPAGAWVPVETVRSALGIARERDVRRRYLAPLRTAEVVELSADGSALRLASGWRAAVEDRRKQGGEIEAAERQRVRDSLASEAFASAWRKGEVISKAELARRRRNRDRIRAGERHISGTVAELERVPAPDLELVATLREFLRRNPHRTGEKPPWFAVALWAEDYVEGKPQPEAVALALAELQSQRTAA